MTLPELAKTSVEAYIKGGEIIEPPADLPKEFSERKSGVFVTIYTKYKIQDAKYELRGCIGTYLPTRDNIAEETIHNAISAATEDYRFGPIRKEELPHLTYTVYILSEPELVMELDPVKWASPKIRRILFNRVDPKKYGIIVKTMPITHSEGADVVFNGYVPYKSGLLLPDLEGVDTIEEQISIACHKGGIDPQKEKVLIYRFTVEKYQ